MKSGRTLSEVAAEIERQARTKQDYIADTRQLSFAEDGRMLALDGHGSFETRDLALQQIGTHTGIPVPYMRRMQEEAPALLARNVNHWFQAKPAQRMVRVLDGGARAFLSSRYARIDNLEVAETVLPVLGRVAEQRAGWKSSPPKSRKTGSPSRPSFRRSGVRSRAGASAISSKPVF